MNDFDAFNSKEYETIKLCEKETFDKNNNPNKINIYSMRKINSNLYILMIFDNKGKYYSSTCMIKKELEKHNIINPIIEYINGDNILLNKSILLEIDYYYGLDNINKKIIKIEEELNQLKKIKKEYENTFYNFN